MYLQAVPVLLLIFTLFKYPNIIHRRAVEMTDTNWQQKFLDVVLRVETMEAQMAETVKQLKSNINEITEERDKYKASSEKLQLEIEQLQSIANTPLSSLDGMSASEVFLPVKPSRDTNDNTVGKALELMKAGTVFQSVSSQKTETMFVFLDSNIPDTIGSLVYCNIADKEKLPGSGVCFPLSMVHYTTLHYLTTLLLVLQRSKDNRRSE